MAIHPDSARGIGVGTVVADTYEITGLIGRGGMGEVWLADHRRLPGHRVAIKVLLADVATDGESLARFRREAEIASKLGHPNIVQVIDFNTLPNGGPPYLVLEYLQGESLDLRLARGSLALSEVTTLIRQIGSGLSAAHRENVVHRDLKPQNIFLTPTEMGGDIGTQVKILDFGISKIRGSQTIKTQESTILGTPQYMAPEQATGAHKDVDQTTDVFALGAIVYEMLAGKPAFGGQSVPEVVFKVVYEQPAPLKEAAPELPDTVVAAVERAMSKKQSDRFASVNELIEALTGRPLVTLRGTTPVPIAPAPSAQAATAETQAAGSEAFAETMHSGNHPAPAIPMPSAADMVHGDTGRRTTDAGADGEALAKTIATTGSGAPLAPPQSSRKGLVAIAGAVLIAGAAAAFALSRDGDDSEPGKRARVAKHEPPPAEAPAAAEEPTTARGPAVVKEPIANEQPAAGSGPAVAEEPAANEQPAAGGGPAVAEEPAAKEQPAAAKTPPKKPPKRDTAEKKEEPAPDEEPESAPKLLQAKRALDDGDATEAIRLAKQALRPGKKRRNARAAAIITVAYCTQQDLGNARSWFRRLPRRMRASVVKKCSAEDLDL